MLTTICFEADDTLWHNERFFKLTEERFAALLADYAQPDHLGERLLDAAAPPEERGRFREIPHPGYLPATVRDICRNI